MNPDLLADRQRLATAHLRAPLGPFEALGRSFTISTDHVQLDALLLDIFADLLAPSQSDGAEASRSAAFIILRPTTQERGLVLQNGDRLTATGSRPQLLGSLVWGINRFILDEPPGHRLLMHAGGVVLDGTAAVLAGVSGAGKSTLTSGLLQRGLAYLSDEAVAIQDDLAVVAYPKPLSIDEGAWPWLPDLAPNDATAPYISRQWHRRASTFTTIAQTARLGLVVFPRYEQGAATWLRELSPPAALELAMGSTFPVEGHRNLVTGQVRRLATLVERVPAVELVNGDLDRACDAVIDALGRLG